ncbi:MAG: hypothetical protein ACKUBY_02075 [Candidatus Moraniibacteriota bacterium]|jgi:hypothetical protein
MKNNIIHKKVFIILIFVSILLVVDFIIFSINQHNSFFIKTVKKYYFANTLEDSRNYFVNYEKSFQTDERIMFNWLWPESAIGTKNAFEEDPFMRLLDISDTKYAKNSGSIEKKYTNVMTDPTDDVLLEALFCDIQKYDYSDFEKLKEARDFVGGYGDTHYLIGLLFLNSLECMDDDILLGQMKAVIIDIQIAQRGDTLFSDLFAERVVVLYWAGEKENIKYNWIEKIAAHQRVNGGWIENGMQESDPHITGLSALAIKYFIEDGFEDVWFAK